MKRRATTTTNHERRHLLLIIAVVPKPRFGTTGPNLLVADASATAATGPRISQSRSSLSLSLANTNTRHAYVKRPLFSSIRSCQFIGYRVCVYASVCLCVCQCVLVLMLVMCSRAGWRRAGAGRPLSSCSPIVPHWLIQPAHRPPAPLCPARVTTEAPSTFSSSLRASPAPSCSACLPA
jgi:hypothetical protein